MKRSTILALLLCVCALAGCRSNQPDGREWKPVEVPAQLEVARELTAEGKTEQALQLLRELRVVPGLSPDLRDEVELETETVARLRLAELEAGTETKPLKKFVDMDLPRQLTVEAAIEEARRYLEAGKDKKVYKTIEKLTRRYPFHHQRAEAGELLYLAADRMSHDRDALLKFMTLRNNGREALEYYCDHFVSGRSWDLACLRIADMYVEDQDWETARQWFEDLLFLRPDSSLRIRAQAEIPHMRLKTITSPEYDRGQILEARRELEYWLSRHDGHALTPRVRRDLRDSIQRLWASDLVVGHFYKRNKKLDGALLHGERALATARELGADNFEAETQRFLASLVELEGLEPEKAHGAENAEELLDPVRPGEFTRPEASNPIKPVQPAEPVEEDT